MFLRENVDLRRQRPNRSPLQCLSLFSQPVRFISPAVLARSAVVTTRPLAEHADSHRSDGRLGECSSLLNRTPVRDLLPYDRLIGSES